MKKAILSLLVKNHFGVLTKVTALFGRRGYNIKALSVGETEDPARSRITIQTDAGTAMLRQIRNQVAKLEEVERVTILAPDCMVERELGLIKLRPRTADRGELMEIAAEHSAKYASEGECVVVEITGTPDAIDAFVEVMKKFTIVELGRTGSVALEMNDCPPTGTFAHQEGEQ